MFDPSISNVSEIEKYYGELVFNGIIDCAKQALDNDIPVVLTIVSLNEDLEKRMLHTKANIINVSGGKDTVKIVKKLREIDPNFPIIATGGPTEETAREVIQAGANAVTFTPPTNGEIFKGMMEEYRHRYD